ncbi:MAG TPA: MG2 domain-containing protein, partial [Candidatus Acidoferrales bacterium]|nr:MG2 domain-containing protein [Candidatus Acidoferrales bacterium]
MNYVRTLVLLGVIAAVAAVASARAQGRVFLYFNGGDVQTPGHPVVLTYNSYVEAGYAIRVVVYRLPRERYVEYVRKQERLLAEGDVNGLPVAARAESGAPSKDHSYTRPVVLPALPIGEYAAVAHVGGDGVAVNVFQVTTLGMLQAGSNRGGAGAIYFPTDLRTYRRYPAVVDMRVIDDAGPHPVRESGGFGRFSEKTTGSAVLAATAPDGSFAVVAAAPDDASNEIGFVQADRPIYRPGDTIALRAILRDGTIGDYSVPAGTRHVSVRAPDGSNVYERDAAISAFGTVAVSVRLPEDAQTGSYAV